MTDRDLTAQLDVVCAADIAADLGLRGAPERKTCVGCPASREGCEARQQFARGERCCRQCSHPISPTIERTTR